MPAARHLDDIKANDDLDALAAQFAEEGFLIIPNLLDCSALGRLDAELDPHFDAAKFGRGMFFGAETKRFGSVLKRSREAQRIALHPSVIGIVERALGEPGQCLQLNLTQAIEIHPGAPVQCPHRDQDMWAGPKGDFEYMVNVMWALDDFTAVNGATRLWPRSHLADQTAMEPEESAISANMPRGSALFFLGSTLHSGGANRSANPRRGLIMSYCLGWLKPWENQWLAYPPPVAKTFSPELAALVGYRRYLPGLGNFEGQCPSILLADDPLPDHLPFTDALKEEHYELMRQYYESLAAREQEAANGGRDDSGVSLAAK